METGNFNCRQTGIIIVADQTRYSEEQIISILKEAEAGIPITELCRKYGISDATYYNWKARYGG